MQQELSRGDDFCAFTFLFPITDGSFGVKTRCYITSYTLTQLPAATRNKYDELIKEESLIVLEGNILDLMEVYDDLDRFIDTMHYDVVAFGYDPYNAKEFVNRYEIENGSFGVEKVIQGARTESVPLGEIKKLAEGRLLLFDQEMMVYTMGNAMTVEDTNGNRKLVKDRRDKKIDSVSALMDALVAYKLNKESFE